MKPEQLAPDDRRRPTSLAGLLAWAQRHYVLESPPRLHDRDIADDGAPDHTGEAKGYIGLSQRDEPNNWRRVACRMDEDGFYLTPMRCALDRVQGHERRQLLRGLLTNAFAPLEVTRVEGIPDWCASLVMRDSLDRLWSQFSKKPIPQVSRKSDAQLDAEAS